MNKDTIKIIIFSIQESFITLFPYLILRAAMTLLVLANTKYVIFDIDKVAYLNSLLYDLFPFLVMLSLSMQLSKNFKINKANFTIASTISFLFLSGYIGVSAENITINPEQSLIFALTIPMISLLIVLLFKKILYAKSNYEYKDDILMQSYYYIYYYIFIFLLAITPFTHFTKEISKVLFSTFSHFSIEIQALFHLVISHLTWLVGLHGTTSYRYIFDMEFYSQYIYTNFSYETFFSTFVIFGGAGSTLSLIIAILIVSHNKRYKFIAKSSLPFSIFNINEPIIYALPIVLNKNFLLPFLLVPLVNFVLSLILLQTNLLTIANTSIPWTTPPLLSGYLLTDSFVGVMWQIFLISLGTLIYIPFSKKEDTLGKATEIFRNKLIFSNKLGIENQNYFHNKRQDNLRLETIKISKTLQDITEGQLILYYQPQINIRTNTIYGFEALLRLDKSGITHPPTFLSLIEKAGLEETIDMWVVYQVSLDYNIWSKFQNQKISINIYPKTLLNIGNVNNIISMLSGKNIQIELVEKGFDNNLIFIKEALNKLRKAGFIIALDDYGSKEANISLLNTLQIDVIKLDRTLIKSAYNKQGKSLFIENCKMLRTLNITIIAEAIETEEELNIVKSSEVDIVQGWYYAPALPLNDAIKYTLA